MISRINKIVLLAGVALCLVAITKAQSPVQWTYTSTKIDAYTYKVHLTATLAEGWHIYAQEQPKEGIAIPTKIVFKTNPLVKPLGEVLEIGKKETQKIDALDIEQYEYAHNVDFVQTITLKAAVKTTLAGIVTFQVCKEHLCMPPKEETFTFSL